MHAHTFPQESLAKSVTLFNMGADYMEAPTKDYFGMNQNTLHSTIEGFSVEPVLEGKDRMATYRLRSEVYCDEYQWASSVGGYERDNYDDYATHFIAKGPNNQVAGTIRTVNHHFDWMADTSFNLRFTDSAKAVKNEHTNEGSRLAIQSAYRNVSIANNITVLDMLLSALFQNNNLTGIKASYFITFPILAKLMKKRGLKVESLSDVITMDDGCKIQAFIIDSTQLDNYAPYHEYMNMRPLQHYAA